MNDDEALRLLTRAMTQEKQDGRADARWEAMCEGEADGGRAADPAEAQHLDARGIRAREAYRPLDASTRDRIVSSLTDAGAPKRAAPETSSDRAAPSPIEHGKLVPLRARWARRGALVIGPLALAAAVLLVARRPTDLPALPSFELSVSGGDVSSRGPDLRAAQPLRLPPGSRFELLLRPSTRVQGPLVAKTFAARGGEVRETGLGAQVSGGGATRIQGTADELSGLAPGAWDLVVVVGRPGAVPLDAGALLALMRSGGPAERDGRLLRCPVVLGSAP
jgi:hypothetical protein